MKLKGHSLSSKPGAATQPQEAKLKVEGKKRRFLLLIIQFIVFSVGILGKRDEIQ